MGGKNQTSTTQSSQTYTPTGAAQLNDIWGRIQGVASQPYTPYGGQLTAGLSGTQQTAIGNLTGPNYGTATGYAQEGAQSIDPSEISRYENPYTKSVIDATQNQFNNTNAQQQQQVVGNAAIQGALGGDRVGVARAQLANQQNLAQAPVIAGLNSQNYTQALQAAQADRAAKASGAQNLSNVSTQGALAQLGAGGVEQQTNQAGLSAQYQQYLQQLAFPYQQAQFLAQYGLPTAQAMGGTQNGQSQTTTPGPSPWGQAAGLGLTAAGLFLKRGGRVKGYASGGSPMGADNFILVPSYIPQSQAPQSHAPQMTPMQSAPAVKSQDTGLPSAGSLSSGIGGLQRLVGSFGGGDQGTIGGTNPFGSDSSTAIYARGGSVGPHDDFVNTVHSIRRALKSGGAVTSPPPGIIQGYDIGGSVYDVPYSNSIFRPDADDANIISPLFRPGMDKVAALPVSTGASPAASPMSFADRAAPAQEAVSSGAFDPQGANNTPFTQAPELTPSPVGGNVPLPQSRPAEAPTMMADADAPQSPMAATRSGLPPQVTDPDQPIMVPNGGSGAMELSAQSKQPERGLLGNLLGTNISPEAKAGLLSAGLGMLASRSPFALQAIGEGGLQGVKAYTQATEKAADREVKKQHVDTEARKLAQSAEQFAKNFGLNREKFEDNKQQNAVKQMQPVKIGSGIYGDIFGIRDPKTGKITPIDSKTGLPQSEAVTAPQSSVTPPDTGDTTIPGAARPVSFLSLNDPVQTQYRPEALSQADPALVPTVKAIAEGRRAPLTLGRNNQYNRNVMELVQQYNPGYDATTFPSRQKTINAFKSGAEGKNVTSLNTVGQHLEELNTAFKDLDNSRIPLYNKARQFIGWQAGDKEYQNKIKSAQAAVDAVSNEAAKAFVGGGQTALTDRQEWKQLYDITAPLGAQQAAIRKTVKLLDGRINALGSQYNQGMSTGHDPYQLLQPKTKEAFDRLRNIGEEGQAPAKPASPAASSADPLASARNAIAKGAPRDAVIKRLQDAGVDTSGL